MPDKVSNFRRLLVTGLLAALPLPMTAMAQQSSIPTASAKASGPPASKMLTKGTLQQGGGNLAGCSSSDPKCCYYSQISGDACCPALKVGPTRANITAAQFRALQIKNGDMPK